MSHLQPPAPGTSFAHGPSPLLRITAHVCLSPCATLCCRVQKLFILQEPCFLENPPRATELQLKERFRKGRGLGARFPPCCDSQVRCAHVRPWEIAHRGLLKVDSSRFMWCRANAAWFAKTVPWMALGRSYPPGPWPPAGRRGGGQTASGSRLPWLWPRRRPPFRTPAAQGDPYVYGN